jgi:hypothetical protein
MQKWRLQIEGLNGPVWVTVEFDSPSEETSVIEKHPEAEILGRRGISQPIIETPVPGIRRQLPVSEVRAQIMKTGYTGYLHDVVEGSTSISAHVLPHMLPVLLHALRYNKRFKEGLLFGLHRDIGDALTDFRSHTNEFGEGSLQFVIDKQTGRFYADVDKFSPYSDAVGFVGHAGEVIGHFVKRWFS